MKRSPRVRSVGNHPAARYVWGAVTLALLAGAAAWIGPIDTGGGRRELGKAFVIFLFPVLAAVFAFDPVVRFLDRRVYPKALDSEVAGGAARKDAAISKEDLQRRARERAVKSQAGRPFSSSRSTPWLYAAGVIGVIVILFQLASFIEVRDEGSLAWVIVFGTSIAAIPAYDPIVRTLDSWFGSESPER
ncbi:MAG: hypothetical protein AAGG01_04725 [Planctomycetota bacterium]